MVCLRLCPKSCTLVRADRGCRSQHTGTRPTLVNVAAQTADHNRYLKQKREQEQAVRVTQIRIRTLMIAVAVVAIVIASIAVGSLRLISTSTTPIFSSDRLRDRLTDSPAHGAVDYG